MFDGNLTATPDQNLWMAVLASAIHDLTSKDERARWEAFEFFLQPKGPWAESRREIFDLLGIEEVVLVGLLAVQLADPPERPDMGLAYTNEDAVLERLPTDKIFVTKDVAKMFGITPAVALERIKILVARGDVTRLSKYQYCITGAEIDETQVLTVTPAMVSRLRILDALNDGPLSIRRINFALEGDVSTTRIREILYECEEKGIVTRDVTEWSLVSHEACAA